MSLLRSVAFLIAGAVIGTNALTTTSVPGAPTCATSTRYAFTELWFTTGYTAQTAFPTVTSTLYSTSTVVVPKPTSTAPCTVTISNGGTTGVYTTVKRTSTVAIPVTTTVVVPTTITVTA